MGIYLRLLLVLGLMASIVWITQGDPGYLRLHIYGWDLETTITFSLLVLTVGLLLISRAVTLLLSLVRLPRRLHHWSQQRQQRLNRTLTQHGLIALAEGHWRRAEQELSRSAAMSDTPLINYLGAARAAQKRGRTQQRDHYLSQAAHSMPDEKLAVGLTQAEVQLSSAQVEQSLATLRLLQEGQPRHPYILYLLRKVYQRLSAWEDLLLLIPQLLQQRLIPDTEARTLALECYTQRLSQLADDLGPLQSYWQQIPRPLQHHPELLLHYATLLIRHQQEPEAEQLLHGYLKGEWHPQLIRLFGQLQGGDPLLQLNRAETWLGEYPKHPELLLALGRLAARAQLWGKARGYYEASIGIEPRAESYAALAQLLSLVGPTDQAKEYYRKGLEIALASTATH